MSFHSGMGSYPGARIKVIGIGGGGTNAVNSMIRSNIDGVDFIAANTDIQSLHGSLAGKKIQVGKDLTKGLGAGADPDIGRDAALEDRHELQEAISGADMVFVTAGMGGGTGTGGISIISQIAKEQGALTVGVVTKPFFFEGKRRRKHAEIGIERLKEHVDTLIVIPNQRLLQIATPDLSMIDAFKLADNVLVNAVRGISDIINIPGTINVDFADVKTVMSCMGQALMGIGYASGEHRAIHAAQQAISSPLLEDIDIEGATGILINITAGEKISLHEINEACMIIQEAAHEDANIIFGAVIDENLADEIRVTVIATGFPTDTGKQKKDLSVEKEILSNFSAYGSYKKPESSYNVQNKNKRPSSSFYQQAQAPQAQPVQPAYSQPTYAQATQAQATQAQATQAAYSQTHHSPIYQSNQNTQTSQWQGQHGPKNQQTPTLGADQQYQGPQYQGPQNQEPKKTFESSFKQISVNHSDTELLTQQTFGQTEEDKSPKFESIQTEQVEEDPFYSQNIELSWNLSPIEELEASNLSHASHASYVTHASNATKGTQNGLNDLPPITQEIDRKIEEAIKMAEQMSFQDQGQDNEIEIPAFLRNTIKSQETKDFSGF